MNTPLWKCSKCGCMNWADAALCKHCQSPGRPPPTPDQIAKDLWGIEPLGENEERLGTHGHGTLIYRCGPHTYEVPQDLDAGYSITRLHLSWVTYWSGPRENRQLSEEERRNILNRTVALLAKEGAKVEVVED